LEKDWVKKQEIAEYQKKQRADKERKEDEIKKVCISYFITNEDTYYMNLKG
jgi:hypothetical protein